MKAHRIAIFASGSGTNTQNIVDYFEDTPEVTTPLIITENMKARVRDRMSPYPLDIHYFPLHQINSAEFILPLLRNKYNITHLVLAGYLKLIPKFLIDDYPDKILNIHPALLPKYGGKGMYGKYVHSAVKANKEKVTGITIHLVNENFDDGNIIFQKKVSLDLDDSVDVIEKKVRALEHAHYPEIIHQWCKGQFPHQKQDEELN